MQNTLTDQDIITTGSQVQHAVGGMTTAPEYHEQCELKNFQIQILNQRFQFRLTM